MHKISTVICYLMTPLRSQRCRSDCSRYWLSRSGQQWSLSIRACTIANFVAQHAYQVCFIVPYNEDHCRTNSGSSSPPAMGLGVEKADEDIMRRPPRSRSRGMFTTEVILDILIYGFFIGAFTLGAFAYVVFVFGGGELGENCNTVSTYQFINFIGAVN